MGGSSGGKGGGAGGGKGGGGGSTFSGGGGFTPPVPQVPVNPIPPIGNATGTGANIGGGGLGGLSGLGKSAHPLIKPTLGRSPQFESAHPLLNPSPGVFNNFGKNLTPITPPAANPDVGGRMMGQQQMPMKDFSRPMQSTSSAGAEPGTIGTEGITKGRDFKEIDPHGIAAEAEKLRMEAPENLQSYITPIKFKQVEPKGTQGGATNMLPPARPITVPQGGFRPDPLTPLSPSGTSMIPPVMAPPRTPAPTQGIMPPQAPVNNVPPGLQSMMQPKPMPGAAPPPMTPMGAQAQMGGLNNMMYKQMSPTPSYSGQQFLNAPAPSQLQFQRPGEALSSRVIPTTQPLTLGNISGKYESGGDFGTISSGAGDPGGASYGKYQLASKTGTLQNFLNKSGYNSQFEGLKPGTPGFNNRWKDLAQTPDFQQAQHNFIKNTHFTPVRKVADKLGLPDDPKVNEALWSMGVQHGKASQIVQDAFKGKDINSMTTNQIVNTLYDARSKYVSGLSSVPDSTKRSILNRYRNEAQDILGLTY